MLAADSDFTMHSDGTWRYKGTAGKVIVPHTIKGKPVTSYQYMFRGSPVIGVASDNPNVTDMGWMFSGAAARTGHARTAADATKLNNSTNKPSGLTFTVKPQ